MTSEMNKVRWRAWIDGPSGLVISGELRTRHGSYELVAQLAQREFAAVKFSSDMLRHEAMRTIRKMLLEAAR